jgi:SSS family solute:Na+ symporter
MFDTNFGNLDWVIVAVYLVGAGVVGVAVNRYIHNVSDYMVGGRGSGAALNTATFIGTGLGLVTIMYASMDGFQKGFAYMVLGLIGMAVGLTLGSTGFVVKRLRELKLTTIPEYFQRRYSRRVRVTAGIICALAGILNMGLFPKMGATFITHATGLGRSEDAGKPEELFLVSEDDVADWDGLRARVAKEEDEPSVNRRLRELLPADALAALRTEKGTALSAEQKADVVAGLNTILKSPDFYTRVNDDEKKKDAEEKKAKKKDRKRIELPGLAKNMLKIDTVVKLRPRRLNRMRLDASFADEIAPCAACAEPLKAKDLEKLYLVSEDDITDWDGLRARVADAKDEPGAGRRLRQFLPEEALAALRTDKGTALSAEQKTAVIAGLNAVLDNTGLLTQEEARKLAESAPKVERLSDLQVQRLNRMLLETYCGSEVKAYGARTEFTINVITSILIALVLLYTVVGGMVSVIVTDYMQFIVLGLGLGLGLYFCLSHADLGWSGMVGALSQHRGEAAFNPVHKDSYGWLWVLWMIVHFGAAALCWAPEVTRALTSKDPEATKRTFLLGSPGQFIRLALPALLAIAAFCYVSQHELLTVHFFPAGLGEGADHAGEAMPLLLGKIVPSGLLGLLVAGLMAAFMSTHDSYFLCWSSVITRDIIAPLRKRELTDKQQIRITRIAIVCIGAFLLTWGVWYPLPASVWNYMAVTGSVWLCGSIVILIGGMYWKQASSAGAVAALLGGLISVVIIFLPESVSNNTMAMGIAGLANYAFCALLFVVFSLAMPDPPRAEEN